MTASEILENLAEKVNEFICSHINARINMPSTLSLVVGVKVSVELDLLYINLIEIKGNL